MRGLVLVAFLIWCWLLTMRGRFWSAGPLLPVAVPSRAPPVAIVVPARDEAPFIWARLPVEIDIASEFIYRDPVLDPTTLVIGVSQSGETADTRIAMEVAGRQGAGRLTVLTGAPRPAGWAGKLWAVHQGIAAAREAVTAAAPVRS